MKMKNVLRSVPAFFLCGLLIPFSTLSLAEETPVTSKVKSEFRLAQDEPAQGLTAATLPANGNEKKGETIYLFSKVELNNADIKNASKIKAPNGGWAIGISFTPTGGEKMLKLTKANAPSPDANSKKLAILIDGKPIVASKILGVIRAECQISGTFNEKEVDRIVNGLKQVNLKQ